MVVLKKRPFYRVVAADQRFSRDGRYLEKLGYFNPVATGEQKRIELDSARVDYWVGEGAQMSDRVVSLVKEFSKTPATAA